MLEHPKPLKRWNSHTYWKVALAFGLLASCMFIIPKVEANDFDRNWLATGNKATVTIVHRDVRSNSAAEAIRHHGSPKSSGSGLWRSGKKPGSGSSRRVYHLLQPAEWELDSQEQVGMAWLGRSRFKPRGTAAAAKPAADDTGDTAPVVEIDAASLVTIEDVASLVTDGGSFEISPADSWVLINKPVYFMSSVQAHTRQVEVYGFPVVVELMPVRYEWNPGDGSPVFHSTVPGDTWPQGTVTHTYLRPGVYSPQVAVTWRAQFTVEGYTYPVDGEVTTRAQATPFEVIEARARITR
ncbi:Uncharacterised protein [Actinobaculum suis]|uniref:PKD domain-containing protein n=2 Tax=Actinobaculum suis TaxID=1657 RepID=A0A7Z9C8U2_9ACTO|nr:Uncharacterised protein [Actinobaculum suis]